MKELETKKIIAEEILNRMNDQGAADVLSDIIENRGGIATYTLISNQGTENECENEVVLMKKQADFWADNIREKNNGSDMLIQEGDIILKDLKGDDVDLFFVDEICFKADETI